jgi:hypothetical protein
LQPDDLSPRPVKPDYPLGRDAKVKPRCYATTGLSSPRATHVGDRGRRAPQSFSGAGASTGSL